MANDENALMEPQQAIPESPFAAAARMQPGLMADFEIALPRGLSKYPIGTFIATLHPGPWMGQYGRLDDRSSRVMAQIRAEGGDAALAAYHRLALATLIAAHPQRQQVLRIPASVERQYEVEFNRILAQLKTNRAGFYLHDNDLFLKDLGVCRGKLLPCGAQLVDVRSGVARRILTSGGVAQALRALSFFGLHCGGFKPLLELHFDPRASAQFTPDAWDRCYLRIADILALNGDILGVFGSSWWFDPTVPALSPKLSFLLQRPLSEGARTFRVGSDDSALKNATRFSKERSEAVAQGRYVPTHYTMAWPARHLIEWARRARAGGLKD